MLLCHIVNSKLLAKPLRLPTLSFRVEKTIPFRNAIGHGMSLYFVAVPTLDALIVVASGTTPAPVPTTTVAASVPISVSLPV